jgi:hypothetical protein
MGERFCRALAWVHVKGRAYPVLPRLSVTYFLGGAILCVACLYLLEEAVRIAGTRYKLLATHDWVVENLVINANVRQKVLVDRGDSVWRSRGIDPPERKERRKRILVLGDSFVWGDGYANVNDTWWRQLERELSRRGFEDVEVIAAGYCGASTKDQLRLLTQGDLVRKYGVDAVIVGFVTNDPDEEGLRRARGMLDPPPAFLSALAMIAPRVASLAEDRWVRKQRARQKRAYVDWEGALYQGDTWERYGRTVAALAAFRDKEGVPLFVLTLPSYPNGPYFRPKFRKAAHLFGERGVPFFDTLDAMVARFPDFDPRSSWTILRWGINPANGHPGPASTRFFAAAAADILEREYPQVLGPRRLPAGQPAPRINDWMPAALDLKPAGEGRWTFVYPDDERNMPRLPLGRAHVLLSLENPVPVRAVRLRGGGLRSAGLAVTCADPLSGIDSGRLYRLGSRRGEALEWDLEDEDLGGPVNTLSIWAKADGEPLTLELVPPQVPAAR